MRAHGLLDEIEQPRGLLDARARLGAHMHQDLAGIDLGEEVLAEERPQAERDRMTKPMKPTITVFGRPSASDEQRPVTARGRR